MMHLPEEVEKELLNLEQQLNTEEINRQLPLLTEENHWKEARETLKDLLAPDEKGFKMLFCMLKAAEYSHEKYQAQGISEEIFTDTMECFLRFVKEHKETYGYYGFDRDFWTGRQLSLLLFRIGELEFEKYEKDEKREISIHIPSDAVLTRENCVESIQRARQFFEQQDKDYTKVPYTCDSWLLSPALKELLPESSRILQFQDMFEIQKVKKEEKSYLEWVFKTGDIPAEELPEDTSLQRKMKEHLLKGGWIGEAEGVLR